LLALAALAVVVPASPIMPLPEDAGEDSGALLTKLNDELDALVETGETSTVAFAPPPPKIPTRAEVESHAVKQSNKPDLPSKRDTSKEEASHSPREEMKDPYKGKPMPTLSMIPGYKETAEDKRDRLDPDPFKQRGTYTKDMKAQDDHYKWANKNPVTESGVKRPWDEIRDFKDPKAKVERAKKIARDIYHLIHRPIAKKVEETAEERSIRLMKEKFGRSTRFLNRILKANRRKDRKSKKRSKARNKRLRKEKRKPKLAFKHKIRNTMDEQDRALSKKLDKMKPAAWAMKKALEEGKPKNSAMKKQREMPPN